MGMFVAFGNAFLKTKIKSDSWDWAVHARSLADAALGWRWECLQLSNGFPEATIQVWSFIGDGMAVKGIEGRDDRDAYCTERANW